MEKPILTRPAQRGDSAAWERMRQTLWPSAPGEHAGEIDQFFDGNRERPAAVLIACDDSNEAIRFAELSIRPYAEECYSGRVAYLEGWFVEATARRRGVGAALVKAAEEWGRAARCRIRIRHKHQKRRERHCSSGAGLLGDRSHHLFQEIAVRSTWCLSGKRRSRHKGTRTPSRSKIHS